MTIAQVFCIFSLVVFVLNYSIFIWLRYYFNNLWARWHVVLWFPLVATLGFCSLNLLLGLIPKSEWDMGPTVSIILIGPFGLAFVLSAIFRPKQESFNLRVLILTCILYSLYLASAVFILTSSFGKMPIRILTTI